MEYSKLQGLIILIGPFFSVDGVPYWFTYAYRRRSAKRLYVIESAYTVTDQM